MFPLIRHKQRPLTVKAGHSSPIVFVDVVWLWRKARALCEGWWAAAGSAWRQRENHHLRCCEVSKKLYSPNPWHFELGSFRVLQVIWPRKSAKKEREGYVLADNPMSIYCIVLACWSHKWCLTVPAEFLNSQVGPRCRGVYLKHCPASDISTARASSTPAGIHIS